MVVVDWTAAGRGPRIVSLAWFLSLCTAPAQVDAVVAGYRTQVAPTPADFLRVIERDLALDEAIRSERLAIDGDGHAVERLLALAGVDVSAVQW